MLAFLDEARWFPVSLQTDAGVPVLGILSAAVNIEYQLNDNPIATLVVGDGPLPPATWLEIGVDTGLYRFQYTPTEAGMVTYWAEAATAVRYEGAIDVISVGALAALTLPVAGYYASYDDMLAEIENLVNYIPDGYGHEAWTLQRMLKAQWVHVDPVLKKLGYTVPLSTTDTSISYIVRGVTINATAYEILRPRFTKQDPNASDWVDSYLETARNALNSLVKGDTSLAVEAADSAQSSTRNRYQEPFTLPQADAENEESTSTW